ncbi:pre-toxin TG domain-containing protein [Paenibacillus hunanensis]|uniref:pre-toxin TG domain-containing protein n=1 Tax=Paenibacillus hunanensis TaxID=539262 RepID=UPI0016689B89|nr:pre-toxin TG domain-containing protein [Paenibacillus hunanensis]
MKQGGSFIADAIPFVGTAKGIQEVFTGVDLITGQQLSVTDRVAAGGGTLLSWLPGGKVAGKWAVKGTVEGGTWLFKKLKHAPKEIFSTGGRLLDPEEFYKQEAIAEKIYKEIRASSNDVELIAVNTGWKVSRINRIKDHVFFKAHTFRDGSVGIFDPDYEMAQAWIRLQKGTYTTEDIRLLNHEFFESRFEGIFKTDYGTAHDATISPKSGRTWTP